MAKIENIPNNLSAMVRDGAVTQRALLVGFALLLVLIGVILAVTVSARRQNAEMIVSFRAQEEASRLLVGLQDTESSQRGFLLSHKPAYLDGYGAGRAVARTALAQLDVLGREYPARAALSPALRPLVDAKLDELDATIRLGRRGDWDGALAVVRTDTGRALMTSIRGQLARARAAERARLSDRIASADRTGLFLLMLSVIGAILLGVLAVAASNGMRRQNRSLSTVADELAAANDRLEARVAERTRALTTANEEIQRFAYLVSHDLRAPLVNVMGFTSELEAASKTLQMRIGDLDARHPGLFADDARTAAREDLPEAIGFIRASTGKMDRLIAAILKLSREGRPTLAAAPVDMDALMAGIGQTLTTQLEAAEAKLEVGALPQITSDRLALEQVFGNLIENAVKYLRPGRPGLIGVTGERDGAEAVYTVHDNGRGIAPADHARVFELFRRAGTQDRPGEGIGLAHVQSLVRRLGGVVTLQSTFGEGSAFTVRLPLAPDLGNAGAGSQLNEAA